MRTNLLLILPLVLMALVARTQPQTIGYLNEVGGISSAADVGGELFFSSRSYLYRTGPEEAYVNNFANLEWNSEAVNMTDVEGVLYFTQNRPDASALWRVNEGGEIVQVIEFTNTFSQISPLVHLEGVVYFGFQDKLYRSDGTEAGTSMVSDLGSSGDQGFLRLLAVGGSLYIHFRKSDMDHELWRSDGTTAGTSIVDSFTYIEFLQESAGEMFFVGDNGISGRELWKVSGSTTTNISDFDSGSGSSFAKGGNPSAAGNGSVVVATVSPEAVWMVNATVQQLSPLGASEIVFAGGKFVFLHGNDVWATSGTYNTTSRIKIFDDTRPGYPRLSNLTGLGNSAFFTVDGMQLWQTDGTTEGTIILYDHTPSGNNPSGTMSLMTAGGQLYYAGNFNSNNEMAWQTDVFMFNPDDVWVPSIQLVNASSNQDIRVLENPAVIFVDQPISIRADASLATSRVVFALNGENVRTENARPFSLAGDNSGDYNAWNVDPGEYELRITPYDAAGVQRQSVVYNITVVSSFEGCGTGSLVRDIWTGIPGSQVSLIPRDRRPTGTQMLSSFEGPTNSGTNYGARIKGYVCPPETGAYIFWISSNDHSELWLSTDDNPVNKVRIAHVGAATNPTQWDKFPSQQSSAIQLQAGKQYYIEAWHKQGAGSDHVAVGWQLPGGELERPIPGNRLSPFTGNHPPEVRVLSPEDGQVFTAPASIRIQPEIFDTDGFPIMIRYYAGTRLLRETTDSYFDWTNVPAGSYELYVQVTDNDGATNTSDTVTVVVTGQCTASGAITHERWNGVQGSSVSDIPVNGSPDETMELSSFEAPANSGTHYGARVRGYICPPSTGDYIFWISSNDHSELWLSSDDDPTNKDRIAWVTGATNPQQWNKFNSQRSSPVALVQGKRYYIEALHKQGVGGDHLAVGWALPDGTLERPITGNRLSPFGETTAGPVSFMTYPADGADDIDPMVMRLEVEGVVGSARYTVELIPEGGGPAKTLTSIDDYQTTFIVKDLEHATTYNVRVKTDASGFGPVSQFTTRDAIGLHRLWGITSAGGADGLGTVFSYSIDSARLVKHHDQLIVREYYGEGEDDYVEYEEMLIGSPVPGPDGTLYGQSDHVYSGNLFVMDQNAQLEWLNPLLYINEGNIMIGSNNQLFVTTAPGLEGGGIDRYNLMTSEWGVDLRVFNQREFGWDPRAVLTEASDGYLYGTTREGGLNNGGVLYRLRSSGSAFEIIHYFDAEHSGMNPFAGLTEGGDGYLYGTTARGGIAGGHGTIFRIRPDGSDFEKLHDFDGWNGRQPKGELLLHDGVVYGTTTEGGAGNHGVVFRINPEGTGFMLLHEFSGNDGSKPSGKLVLGPDEEVLFAMTTEGGANNMGVIFEINRTGTDFNKLYDFSSWSGGRPEGSLVMREDMFSPSSAAARMTSDENIELSVHPNPTTDGFNVHVKAPGGEKIKLVVTDQYGQLITTYEIANGTPVQVGSELQRGLYIMKIIQGNRTAMKRLVKN